MLDFCLSVTRFLIYLQALNKLKDFAYQFVVVIKHIWESEWSELKWIYRLFGIKSSSTEDFNGATSSTE